MKVNAINSISQNNMVVKHSKKFTNADAEKLLRKELSPSMPKKSIDFYISRVRDICKKLKIQFKDLPINAEHSGKLNAKQTDEFCQEVFNIAILG